jgi:hypothetical protein
MRATKNTPILFVLQQAALNSNYSALASYMTYIDTSVYYTHNLCSIVSAFRSEVNSLLCLQTGSKEVLGCEGKAALFKNFKILYTDLQCQ